MCHGVRFTSPLMARADHQQGDPQERPVFGLCGQRGHIIKTQTLSTGTCVPCQQWELYIWQVRVRYAKCLVCHGSAYQVTIIDGPLFFRMMGQAAACVAPKNKWHPHTPNFLPLFKIIQRPQLSRTNPPKKPKPNACENKANPPNCLRFPCESPANPPRIPRESPA